jgi:Alkylmercury lyase
VRQTTIDDLDNDPRPPAKWGTDDTAAPPDPDPTLDTEMDMDLDLEALVERELAQLREAGLLAGLPIGLTWLRLQAEGRPTTPDEIAAALGWPVEQVTERTTRTWTIMAPDGQIVEPAPDVHLPHYQIHWLDSGKVGQVAGCSFDALAAVLLAGRPARLRLPCPATGERISVRVGPDGRLAGVDPPGAVAIMRSLDSAWHPRDWVRSDCARGLWFASAEAASGWLAGHPGHLAAPMAFHVAFKVRVFGQILDEAARHTG